jgi:hypothetical protein
MNEKKEHQWLKVRMLPPNRHPSSDFARKAVNMYPTQKVACYEEKRSCRFTAKTRSKRRLILTRKKVNCNGFQGIVE